MSYTKTLRLLKYLQNRNKDIEAINYISDNEIYVLIRGYWERVIHSSKLINYLVLG